MGNTSFSDAGLELLSAAPLPSGITTLQLDFGDNANFTDTGLSALANGLPRQLESLQLKAGKCKSFTNAGYAALARGLPKTLTSMRLWLGYEGCMSHKEFSNVQDFRHSLLRVPLDDPTGLAHNIWKEPLMNAS